MARTLPFILCCLMLHAALQAQQLNGSILNEQGGPVPFSTLYIHEIARGIAADNLGQFQTRLAPGTYTFEFRSLGYENLQKRITIDDHDQTIRVVMKETSYVLDEVEVFAGSEDPAYRIMRKAIAHAPYHRYQVKDYRSEAYIKGSLTIDKIPGLLRNAMKVNSSDVQIDELIGKPLVMESQNNVHFTSPATYQQEVVALKSSIPPEFNISEGLNIMTTSIYNSGMDGRISPLTPGSFRYYAFKLEDVAYQSDLIINKIKVTPRKRNPDLFSGYLYILENSWNVYIADLAASELGTTMHYRINYHQVKPAVYLPTTYDVTMTINTMGVKGSGKYYASLTYQSVEIDEAHRPGTQQEAEQREMPDSEELSPRQQKAATELEKLTQKEELTTREAYRMSKLMSRIVEPEVVKKQRESLEIKRIEKIKKEVDTLAWERDSLYWNRVRSLPLRVDEQQSYRRRDSLTGNDTITRERRERNELVLSIGGEDSGTLFGKITQGGKWEMGPKLSLRYGGVTGGLKEYNFVDGFWLGQTLSLQHEMDKHRIIRLTPSIYYATARKEWLWNVAASLSYAPMSLGRLHLSAGHISRDVNGMNGESRLMNTLAAIALGQNFIRLYDSRYLKADHSIDIANGLSLFTGAEIEKRQPLRNHTSFNIAGRKVPDNISSEAGLHPTHKAAKMMLQLTYTPRYRYYVREGRKQYASSRYPTFSLAYEKGFNLFADSEAPLYDKLSFSLSHTINLSPFETFDYQFTGGSFLSSARLHPHDLHYFRNNQMLFTPYEFNRSFNLLPPYTATGDWWMDGHLSMQSQYLFIKNLPFLQRYSFDEAIHLQGLITGERKLYLEGGYSIGFLGLGRAGIFTSFSDNKIRGVAVRISYPLWNVSEKPIR
ncbi:MAG: DUF5686 family protein [Proteiniphilum sp.]|nr:DUF5686 family protein [Proteiniphilum sp.]